jgi:hypothetical protein
MSRNLVAAAVLGVSIGLAAGAMVLAQPKGGKAGEWERKVKASEVPAAAMTALKKLAGGAAFTEFAEEFEHGHKFYEGSWKGPQGNVDGLVTEGGDLVELEESIPAEMAPSAVRSAAQKAAGKGTDLRFEKKTFIVYEVHFKRDGRHHEAIFRPTGDAYHEHGQDHGPGEEGGENEE